MQVSDGDRSHEQSAHVRRCPGRIRCAGGDGRPGGRAVHSGLLAGQQGHFLRHWPPEWVHLHLGHSQAGCLKCVFCTSSCSQFRAFNAVKLGLAVRQDLKVEQEQKLAVVTWERCVEGLSLNESQVC